MTCKAFITGITGMVGSHMLDFLIEHTEWEVHGLIRWRSPLDNIKPHLHRANIGDRFFLHYGDLNDPLSIDKAVDNIKPDYVFHLAAQSFPRVSFDAPIDTYNTNINGTQHLLDAIKKFAPSAVVHVCSSSEVFGRVPKEFVPIDEEVKFHPASPYAISKCGTDLIGRYFGEAFGICTIVTRMFTHTGPRRGDVFAESTFAKQIALAEAGLIPPVVKVGNLDSLRTIADVRDAVRAYHMAVTINPIPGSYYNIGGSHTTTVKQLLDDLISLSTCNDISIEVDPDRLRPIDADLQIPNIDKFRKHTGWTPEIAYEKTISDLLEYWRKEVGTKGEFLTR